MLRNLILLAFLAASALAILPNHYHFKDKLNKAARLSTGNANVPVTTAYMIQNLDHYNGNASGTFIQRYYYTESYTLHQRTAFLYISVSGDFETSVITDDRNPVVKSAKQFGATVFSLEHRYYGQSKPNVANFDSNSLRYLNSFQAIQDIVAFIKYANKQFNMDPDVRWVLWGAGYGGVIAAEARKWNPDVVAGVIASSSPLTHVYDFWQFNDHVQIAISQEGGQLCYQKIMQGFTDIRLAMRTPEGRSNISDLFQLNPRLDQTNLTYNDIQTFYLAIMSPFQEMIQFNNDFNIDIGALCTTIDQSTWTPMQVIWQAYVYLSTTVTGSVQPMITSYQTIVSDLGNQSASSPNIDNRMWQYQMCTEFGWIPTTNNNEQGLFGAVIPTSLFLNMCFDIFPGANMDATTIRDLTIDYNHYYGSSYDYSGTNVVFTNGWYDPWSTLGKETTADFSVVAYVIPGASWASDMFPGSTNNTFIINAHRLMAENINIWVNGPKNPKTFVNTTIPWTRPAWGEFAIFEETTLKEDVEARFTALGDDVPSKKTFPEPRFKKVFLGRPPHGFLPEPDYEMPADMPPGFEQGMFRQRENHFDNRNPDFFQQKFYKNSQWAQPGGPNFLMIGGEGPEGPRWVLNENLTWLTYAKKYGATVFILEHRFYGDSLVGQNNDNFNVLTSLQMLYDLAEFIKAVNIRTGTSAPWITFGGSYSGAMSAWMREVFPELVIGAVASSGPVFAKTDFYEYLMVVEKSIRTYDKTCADRIQSGFSTMQTMFQTKEGRQNLSDIFQLQPPFGDNVTDTDQHYFFSNIYGNFQGAVQYSGDNTGPYANGYGIPDMCKFMTNDSNTPLNNIVQFNEYMTVFYNNGRNYTGTDNKYQDMIDSLVHAQESGPESAASLLWTWQTCNEFGYFQSADTGNGIFGSPTPVNMFVQMCMDVFGSTYQRIFIDNQIAQTNYKYGERQHYRGTNVVFPNGNVDPWHALGLYGSADDSVVAYLINGTAHCADMYPARAADVPGLKVVRDIIDTNIGKWLSQANAGTTTGVPSTANPATGAPSKPTVATGGPATSTATPAAPVTNTTTAPTASSATGSPSTSPATVQTSTKSAATSTVILSFIAVFATYLL
ncbi:Protein CBR-PCP-3 [Caenorhabditis briggsae]|uniref:Protein CBR-PCP-3 n=1 Tax=Caenorhabditis briggsae TaxID=6238 RepID=A8Y0H1_CAEBR|nr:Protein CBR-PCP-3 [Caenorhabditis briggsae]CAP38389.2 Protein CBR-PCP-3 [Caenorhabditis briggsae]